MLLQLHNCFKSFLSFLISGKENVVVFDFLGKDSIRYYNEVPVERRVFKNLMLFMENKKPQDDLFDRLNVSLVSSFELLFYY